MRQTRPLPDTHPEFTVTHWQGFTEYRVEHWRLARNGSGRIVRGTSLCAWVDVVVLVLVLVLVFILTAAAVRVREPGRADLFSPLLFREAQGHASVPVVTGCAFVVAWRLWACCTQVLHESVLVFPALGIQLETHRGHPLFPAPLFTTRYFIPLASLEDVVIHEGFRRWSVRYYLAALQRRHACTLGSASAAPGHAGGIDVYVAFEHVLPYFPVLRAVYLGVQHTLFPPPTRIVTET